MGQAHERDDVQLDLPILGVHVELEAVAERAEPGVVHEHVDIGDALFDDAAFLGNGQVRGQHFAMVAVLRLELLGERLEPARVACDEHEIVPAFGEKAREVLADPDRRAGDECDRLGCRRSFGHVDAPVLGTVATRSPLTTMRCAALCFGWQAMSVTVGVSV